MKISRSYLLLVLIGGTAELCARTLLLNVPPGSRRDFDLLPGFGVGVYLNTGSVFGFAIPNNIMIAVMAMALVGILFYWRRRTLVANEAGALLLIAVGAILNISNRILYGGVVDYIHIPFGGVINLADVMIALGAASLVFKAETRYAK